jgi:hypothetical protein
MLRAGKNNERFLKNKVAEKFYLVNTNNLQLSFLEPWLKTNMAACVCFAMTLLLVFAVLILYCTYNQNSHNLESSINRLSRATLQYKSGLGFIFSVREAHQIK